MRQSRLHYTWDNTPKASNCFNRVHLGHKPKQSISILGLLALLALFAKLKE